jgi:sensor histidine kinase YesM
VRQKRKKVWIDRFQTTLSVRLAFYFLLYQVTIWALFTIDSRVASLGDSVGSAASAYGFVLTPVITIGLGLLFIYDALKESHRFVGPLNRFRKTIQAVTAGEDIRLVSLRDGDQLQEMKDDLNAMLRALEQRGAITLRGAVPEREAVTV